MSIRFLLLFLCTSFLYAQDPLPQLLDSLAQTSTESEKARLAMVIAADLAHSDWHRSLKYIDLAEESAKKSRSEKAVADFHIAVGEIYSEKSAWDITLENYLKAYDYYVDKPLKYRYRLENDLAIAYAETANPELALEFFHKIYDYEHTHKNPLNLASISNNMGLVWMEKDLDSSQYYFNQSLHLIRDIDNPGLKVLLYTNLGKSSLLKDEEERANRYFQLALDQIDPNTTPGDLAWVYGEFSELFLKNEKLDSAIYYSKNAVKILDTVAPYGLEQLQAVQVLYKAYLKSKDFEQAALNLQKFLSVSDSLNLEDKRVNVQKLMIGEAYRTKDKLREMEKRESESKTHSFILVLLMLLLILGAFLYRYHNRLKRAELERQLISSQRRELSAHLELKNKELIGKAMIEMHRSEIIEEILKDLRELKLKVDKKETQYEIDSIAKRLKRDTSTNAWEEFELRFEQVHESFYKNLMVEHPDLSPKDKRLCALLKLNLSSKEIAQITGQNAKTVENARTRLRKKLDITNSQTDLSAYLSNFE